MNRKLAVTEAPASMADWHRCSVTLSHEARLLDSGRLRDWLALLAPQVEYRILNRTIRAGAAADPFDEGDYHLSCDRNALELRVARIETGWAFVEDPPAITRRHVSNVQATYAANDTLRVTSYYLFHRGRRDGSAYLSAMRDDLWHVEADGRLLLARRRIYLDHPVLPTDNLPPIL